MHFALHLERASLRLLRLDRAGARGVTRPLDPGLSGDARRAQALAALRECAAELGLKARREVHLAVPRAQALVKQAPLPPAENGELERLVRFQAMKELPFDLEEVELGWARLAPGPGGGPGEVEFVAVRHEALAEPRRLLVEAGFRPARVEVSTQAAARALALLAPQAAEAEEALLVLVEERGAEVVLLRGGRLSFSRSAGVGADDLPRLTQELTRSLFAARAGAPEASADPSASSLGRLGAPDLCFLAGAAAGAPGVAEAVQQAAQGVAPELLQGADGPDGLALLVARGLAEPRDVPGVPRLDLARRAQARQEQTQRRRLTAIAFGLAAVAVAASLGLHLWVAAREARVQALEVEEAALAPVVRQAEELRDEVELAERWAERQGRELEVLLSVSQALPSDDVYLTQLSWSEGRSLRLTGKARGWDAVGTFLAALEQDPLFAQPRFENIRRPQGERRGEDGGVEFSGTAELRGLRP